MADPKPIRHPRAQAGDKGYRSRYKGTDIDTRGVVVFSVSLTWLKDNPAGVAHLTPQEAVRLAAELCQAADRALADQARMSESRP